MVTFHITFLGVDNPKAAGAAQLYLSRAIAKTPGVLARIPFRSGRMFRESLVTEDAGVAETLSQKLRSLQCPFQFRVAEIACAIDAIEKPVIIVGAPRSGTTLLFETLAICPEAWSLGGESHPIFERPGAIPEERGNRLDAGDANPETCGKVKSGFVATVHDRDRRRYAGLDGNEKPARIRLLEKTPKNSLRIPFLKKVFPDCRFVFLYRHPHTNIASLLDIWHSADRPTYTVEGFDWRFLLVPGWRTLVRRPVAEIAAAQWEIANRFIMDDLAELPREDWIGVRYEDFIADPRAEGARICSFNSFTMDERVIERLSNPLPLSRSTKTPPSPDKWRRHEEVLMTLLPGLQPVVSAADAFLKR